MRVVKLNIVFMMPLCQCQATLSATGSLSADAAGALDLLVRQLRGGSCSSEAATETSTEDASTSNRRQSGLRTALAEAAVAHACCCVLSGMATSLHDDEEALLMTMRGAIVPAGGIGAAGIVVGAAATGGVGAAASSTREELKEGLSPGRIMEGHPEATTSSAGTTRTDQQDVTVARSRAELALRYRVARKRLLAQWGGAVQNFVPPPRATAARVSQVF